MSYIIQNNLGYFLKQNKYGDILRPLKTYEDCFCKNAQDAAVFADLKEAKKYYQSLKERFLTLKDVKTYESYFEQNEGVQLTGSYGPSTSIETACFHQFRKELIKKSQIHVKNLGKSDESITKQEFMKFLSWLKTQSGIPKSLQEEFDSDFDERYGQLKPGAVLKAQYDYQNRWRSVFSSTVQEIIIRTQPVVVPDKEHIQIFINNQRCYQLPPWSQFVGLEKQGIPKIFQEVQTEYVVRVDHHGAKGYVQIREDNDGTFSTHILSLKDATRFNSFSKAQKIAQKEQGYVLELKVQVQDAFEVQGVKLTENLRQEKGAFKSLVEKKALEQQLNSKGLHKKQVSNNQNVAIGGQNVRL